MDLVVRLPKTNKGHDAIWVVIDRFTKSAYFLPVRTTFQFGSVCSTICSGDRQITWGSNGYCFRQRLEVYLKILVEGSKFYGD